MSRWVSKSGDGTSSINPADCPMFGWCPIAFHKLSQKTSMHRRYLRTHGSDGTSREKQGGPELTHTPDPCSVHLSEMGHSVEIIIIRPDVQRFAPALAIPCRSLTLELLSPARCLESSGERRWCRAVVAGC